MVFQSFHTWLKEARENGKSFHKTLVEPGTVAHKRQGSPSPEKDGPKETSSLRLSDMHNI